jgi:hypothetical protein
MFDQQPVSSEITLFDGAHVRLAVVGHHKPVFVADYSHGAFLIGGSMYHRDGTPVDPSDAPVVEIVPYLSVLFFWLSAIYGLIGEGYQWPKIVHDDIEIAKASTAHFVVHLLASIK